MRKIKKKLKNTKTNNLLKISAIICAVIILTLIFEITFQNYFGNFDEMDSINAALKEDAKIIYFGDSVVKGYQELIEKKFENEKGLKTKVIAHEAYHLGVFDAFVDFILKQEKKPEIVVIPVNLREFSKEWDTRPQYQFNKEIQKLKESDNLLISILNRFSSLFMENEEKTAQNELEWKKEGVYFGNDYYGRVGEFNYLITGKETDLNKKISGKFIYQYGYLLNENTPKITSLKNSIQKLKNAGIKPIIYITPIDYQKGAELAGEKFETILLKNAELIKQITKNEGAEVLDCSRLYSSEFFEYDYIPNEHLTTKGINGLLEKIMNQI